MNDKAIIAHFRRQLRDSKVILQRDESEVVITDGYAALWLSTPEPLTKLDLYGSVPKEHGESVSLFAGVVNKGPDIFSVIPQETEPITLTPWQYLGDKAYQALTFADERLVFLDALYMAMLGETPAERGQYAYYGTSPKSAVIAVKDERVAALIMPMWMKEPPTKLPFVEGVA